MSIYETLQTGHDMSRQLAEQTAHVASTYPRTEGTEDLVGTLNTVVEMAESPSFEQRATAVVVLGRIATPYLTDRVRQVAVGAPEQAKEGIGEIAHDAQLIYRLYDSTSDLLLSSLKGGAPTKPAQEVAEAVFRGGPLIAKMGQSLPGIVKGKVDERSNYIRDVGRYMQEGVSLPQEHELPALAKTVPEDATLDGVISSASVAHILRLKDAQGRVLAQKVPRPNFDQAMTDNVRAYVVASDVVDSFMKRNSPTMSAAEFDRVREVLPFLLNVLESDIRSELDFEREADMQARAHEALRGSGVHVPEVLPQYTNQKRIVMEYMPGKRIEDAPVDPRHLKNLGVMCVRLWKAGLVHGDMHPGNIKAATDKSGDLIAYDWGRTIERSPGMIKNLSTYMWALARKDPAKIATAYHAIQSPDHKQASVAEVQSVAEDVITSIKGRRQSSPHRGIKRLAVEANAALQGLTIGMGVRHQSSINSDYLAFMRSSASLATLVKDVLKQPAYGMRQKAAAVGGFAKAIATELRRKS